MNCKRCESDRVLMVSVKGSDLHCYLFKGKEHVGYARDFNDGEDYTVFHVCCECGQMQGKFPHVTGFERGDG